MLELKVTTDDNDVNRKITTEGKFEFSNIAEIVSAMKALLCQLKNPEIRVTAAMTALRMANDEIEKGDIVGTVSMTPEMYEILKQFKREKDDG